jgi:hypothetical protein
MSRQSTSESCKNNSLKAFRHWSSRRKLSDQFLIVWSWGIQCIKKNWLQNSRITVRNCSRINTCFHYPWCGLFLTSGRKNSQTIYIQMFITFSFMLYPNPGYKNVRSQAAWSHKWLQAPRLEPPPFSSALHWSLGSHIWLPVGWITQNTTRNRWMPLLLY